MDRFITFSEQDMAEKALDFATFMHAGQVDRTGQDYILHPERVGQAVAHLGKAYEAAGYLHDVVEDTDTTLDDLRYLGFTEEVVEAVDALTKREGENHAERVLRAGRNTVAREVKIADMRDNLRPGCGTLEKRYRKGLAALGATERLN